MTMSQSTVDRRAHRPAAAWAEALRAAARSGSPAAALLGAAVATALGFLASLLLAQVDPRTLLGVSVWTKPAKFHASAAVFLLTLAWFVGYLDDATARGRQLRVIVWATIVAFVVELSYITLQAGRGEASHFNRDSVFTDVMYAVMGLFAVVLVAMAGWLGVLVWRHARPEIAALHRRAGAAGLVLGAVLGGLSGIYLSQGTGHWVGGTPSDAGGLPVVGWSRDGGDLRVAHFLGLHAMQIVPAIGLAVALLRPARPLAWLWGASLVFVALTVASFVQAVAGRPLL